MNILISTTTNWNPGDDFIRYGVKNLLTPRINEEINWIHYDRNPDYFKPSIWEMGSNHKSNIMNNPIDWDLIDAVVLAGSPEFLHGPLKPLYDGLAEHPGIPLLAIGVGYSFEVTHLELTDNEKKVLSRDNTTIITRQYDLQEKLKSLLQKEVHCLPCPALFASNAYQIIQHDEILCIPQAAYGNQSAYTKDVEALIEEAQPYKTHVLVHYIEDLKQFKHAYFTTEAIDLLSKIAEYNIVFTNRLHGGIVALGMGSKVKFFNSSNRVKKALEPYNTYKKEDGFYYIGLQEFEEIEAQYSELVFKWLKNVI